MNISSGKILYQKAALIFEELCFLMPCSDTDEHLQANSLNSAVSFSGPYSGCLLVSVDRQTLSLLVSAMVGDESPASMEFEQDALGEIANVLCGNVLPSLFGPEHPFRLSIPQLLEDLSTTLNDPRYAVEAQAHITFDSGHAAATLLLENRQQEAQTGS